MNADRKLDVLQIVYIQQDEDNYRLVRFTGMDQMRAELRPHGITIGRGVSIGREVLIADGVSIGDGTVIASEATLERGAQIGQECRIGQDAFVGRNTRLGNRVTVGEKTELGRSVIIGDNSELAPDCIVQDNVHIGFASHLRTSAYIGSESVLGHHTVVGAESRLGRMVHTAPSTTIDSHRTLNSFMFISGKGGELRVDEELKQHYTMNRLPTFIGGEQARVEPKVQQPQPEEQTTRRIYSL